jgi:CheY-like chemotaxis protein
MHRAAPALQAAQRADGAAPAIPEPVSRIRCAMPPSILVVDDDPGVRHALVEALLDAGYAVEQASDGLMALKKIARQVPDLILSDVRMPRLDGIGLATTLAPHIPPIPIILMSANLLPYGCAYPFIRKPFTLEALLTLIARTLPVSAVVTVALSGLGAVPG